MLAARLMIAVKSKTNPDKKTYQMKNKWINFKLCRYKGNNKMLYGMLRAFSLDLKNTDGGG